MQHPYFLEKELFYVVVRWGFRKFQEEANAGETLK